MNQMLEQFDKDYKATTMKKASVSSYKFSWNKWKNKLKISAKNIK